jgi:hypothetical protein
MAILLWAVMPSVSFSQERYRKVNADQQGVLKSTSSQEVSGSGGLLSSGDGLAILGAALDSPRPRAHSKTDCSHLAHAIYQRAGFPYAYADSAQLYGGVSEFRRVKHPEAGDLVVWRGHVGIVISPVQRTFYSELRSGPGVDSYDAPYWKSWGRPHFFRYFKTNRKLVIQSGTKYKVQAQ